jgi:Protein of unknown function DUF262
MCVPTAARMTDSSKQGGIVGLDVQIDKVRSEIRTDGYPMSIGEWISLYENKEIDIHPEFQRFFRWNLEQKSRLIESILLGIPVPPVFVSQRKDGVWDVVDGLQRLSTIYQFAGILRDEDGGLLPPLVLEGTGYLPALEGKVWEDDNDPQSAFTAEQRLIIKRSKISVSIILRESDERAKFELFQRLNTGGSSLTQQEVRNCILVMVNRELYLWLRELANYGPFQDCIGLSDRPIAEQYDMELALRFMIFATIELEKLSAIGDVGAFLTDSMVELAKDEAFDRPAAERRFKATFDILASAEGDHAFARYAQDRDRFMGGFILSAFEVIAFGLGYNIDASPAAEDLVPRIKAVWANSTYKEWSGSGITATRRLPRLVPLGRDIFRR